MFIRLISIVVAIVAAAPSVRADTFPVYWDFNSVPPDGNPATGRSTPTIGTGTFAILGPVTAGFAPGYVASPDTAPAADNSSLVLTGFPVQGTGSETCGVEFRFSTAGLWEAQIRYYMSRAGSSSKWAFHQYTVDGVNWIDDAHTHANTDGFAHVSAGYSNDPRIYNNPNFGFRVLSAFEPGTSAYTPVNSSAAYDPAASWRVDMVRVFGQTNRPPRTTPIMRAAAAGGEAISIDLSGFWADDDVTFGDHLAVTSGDGPAGFVRTGNLLSFTPPASLDVPMRSYFYSYVVSDAAGGQGSGVVEVRVLQTAPCGIALTSDIQPSGCRPPPDRDSITVAVTPPPGTGGVISYQWIFNGVVQPPTDNPVLEVIAASTFSLTLSCQAGRTGGTGTCGEGPFHSNEIALSFLSADIGTQGGTRGHDSYLDNNDFIVLIGLFFAQDPAADYGVQGGIAGHDGLFDNNDFIVFIDLFFTGC